MRYRQDAARRYCETERNFSGMDDAQADALLEQLMAYASEERHLNYLHRWRMRDLVLWDNHCTMHQGTAFDDTRYPRDMQRTTTSGKPNVFNADLRTARVATA